MLGRLAELERYRYGITPSNDNRQCNNMGPNTTININGYGCVRVGGGGTYGFGKIEQNMVIFAGILTFFTTKRCIKQELFSQKSGDSCLRKYLPAQSHGIWLINTKEIQDSFMHFFRQG
jgi:hypothetical protein